MNLSTISTALDMVYKGVRIANAANDFYSVDNEKALSSGQRDIRKGLDVGIILTEGASIIAPALRVSPGVQIGLNIGGGVFDVAQRVSVLACKEEVALGDWVDLGCLVTFRACEITKTTLTLRPEIFNKGQQGVKSINDILNNAALLIANRQVLKKAYPLGKKALAYIFNCCPANRETSLAVPRSFDLGESPPLELQIGAEMAAKISEIREAQTIDGFNEIPSLFVDDRELRRFICPITRKPIRNVLATRTSQSDSTPIYYEKSAVMEYMRNHPGEMPPKWPQGLTFNEQNLADSPETQNWINGRLQVLLDDFKEIPNLMQGDELREKMLGFARNLKIGSTKCSNAKIGREIVKNIDRFIRGTVSIQTVEYEFHPGRSKKIATRVRIVFQYIWKSSQVPSLHNQKIAACVVLGSNDPNEIEISSKVVRCFKELELYISNDLQNLSGNFQ